MPAITFSHPYVSSNAVSNTSTPSVSVIPYSTGGSTLQINDIRPDQIQWGYLLNTQNYPTYGGEVVQILSAAVDDLNIAGQVRSYSDMETIYQWFIEYMNIATQGSGQGDNTQTTAPSTTRYDEAPILFQYPHRGWQLYIRAKGLPGLKYGVEVIVPTWQLQAAVVENNTELMLQSDPRFPDSRTTLPGSASNINNITLQGALAGLQKLDASFGPQGYPVENPFNSDFAATLTDYQKYFTQADISQLFVNGKPILSSPNQLTNYFQDLVTNNAQGNFTGLFNNTIASAPATPPSLPTSSAAGGGSGGSNTLGTIPFANAQTGSVQDAFDSAQTLSNWNIPYVYGGGHGPGALASVGQGYAGLDCSSSVSWVLWNAGLFAGGTTAWTSSEFASSYGESGPGQQMTIWADGNDHVFIEFNITGTGHYQLNTSVPGHNGPDLAPWGPNGSTDAASGNFVARHAPGL